MERAVYFSHISWYSWVLEIRDSDCSAIFPTRPRATGAKPTRYAKVRDVVARSRTS